MPALSILNLAPFRNGETFIQAVDNLVALAQFAEQHGYVRYWIAEHHNMPYLASSATSLLIQRVLDNTDKIRVGSGGVMLPNHSPFIVAEQYGTLASLYPDRVDLGLGRAPGTDPATARAIRRHHDDVAHSFPQDIEEIQYYFSPLSAEETAAQGFSFGPVKMSVPESTHVRAYPAPGLNVPLYILGSSTESAYLAAHMGLPYAFASHFAPRMLQQAVAIYRREFRPSAFLDKPKVIVGVNAIVADSDEEARFLSSTCLQFFLNVVTGSLSGMLPPQPDIETHVPPHILNMAESMMSCSLIGSPDTARHQLDRLQESVQADELMAVSYIYDQTAQLRSYKLLADLVKSGR
ncbi:LLM class flavin-dependent oxidoreductase [Neisseria animalis]|uniref:Luciferase-like monooxygenase n=1 Tax=Neisseria animalis TaxID=492 RepID=A0A5P3MTI4_NEIAN|nr:LLM class flavin-dependent oxidoreductase [Neisseria animalis]QEY23959.1 LLM class flavin-dependent oxidoreductase [Neisseria animalis]ROW31643.1 LLM class flavin-dependent oxidoreductase [Neisseria animalis]VEE05956.1 Limonene 1,2-monooxygenase [Neisseria animalis]